MNYPSPCDSCEKCTNLQGCAAWKIRYLYRQKQINGYAKMLYQTSSRGFTTVFQYLHPDELRRYLHRGPCADCKAEAVCDTPCPQYLHWYDARMAVARKKVGI